MATRDVRDVPLQRLGLIDVYKDVLPIVHFGDDENLSPKEKILSIMNQTVYKLANQASLVQYATNETMTGMFAGAVMCLRQYSSDKAHFDAMKAILANDVGTVKEYYQKNQEKINRRFNCFCYYGQQWQFEQYITKLNHTPLTLATKLGHVEMVKVLVSLGADSSLTTSDGLQPVHIASKKGVVELLYFFINQCGVSASSLTSNNEMKTPLMLAVAYRRNQVVKFLLENGANVNQTNRQGRPALFYAVQVGAMNIIEYLRANAANMAIVDKKGGSAIHHLYSKQVQITPVERFLILKYLVDVCGVKIDAAMKDGSRVLHRVAECGTYNEVKFVIKRDGESINARKSGWKTPIWSALMSPKRNRKVLALLLRYGASINDINKDGLSAVAYASKVLGLNEIADLIARIGSDINSLKADSGDDNRLIKDGTLEPVQASVLEEEETEQDLKDEEGYEVKDEDPFSQYENNGEWDDDDVEDGNYGYVENYGEPYDMAPPPLGYDAVGNGVYPPNFQQQVGQYIYPAMGGVEGGYPNNGFQQGANPQYYMAGYQAPGYVMPQPVTYAVDGNMQYPVYFVQYPQFENAIPPQQEIVYPVFMIPYYGQLQGDAGSQYFYPQPQPVFYAQPIYAYQPEPQDVAQGVPEENDDDGDEAYAPQEEFEFDEEDEILEVVIDEPLED